MKLFAILCLLAAAAPAYANSFPVVGAPANALVDSLVALGQDPIGTHEYFQVGVTACAEVFDEQGTYFPNGAPGDYLGEECMIYGESYDNDDDGVLRLRKYLPADDRNLERNPELKAKMAQMRDLRLAMEALVTPIVRAVKVGEREVIAARTTGILGIACDGRNASGQRVCNVLPSSHCPPR